MRSSKPTVAYRNGMYSSFGVITEGAGNVSPRKIQNSVIQKRVEQLSTPREVVTELPPLTPRVVLSRDQVDKSSVRLSMRPRSREPVPAASPRRDPDALRSPEEVAETVSRLYEQALGQQKATMQTLTEKHMLHMDNRPPASSSPRRKANVTDVNTRMYYSEVGKRAEGKKRLEEQYVTSRLPKSTHRSQSEWEETVGRLGSRGQKN
eukprot:PhM_4_TR15532/c0_g1_i1/m.13031